MMTYFKSWTPAFAVTTFAAMATAFVFLAQPVMAADALRGNLVDAKWLAKNLDNPDVLVLDAQPRPLYAKGHVPGAVPVDVFAVAVFGVREAPVSEIEKVYQGLGIGADKKVVIYDQGGTWFAPRVFFSLLYHGFPTKNLFILDGGFAKWQADGLAVTKDPTPAPKAGTFRITKIKEAERTRPAELVTASGDRPAHVLVDAMGLEYHHGATQFFNKGGHIPNAVSLPAEDFFNADKTFKSPAEIKRMLAHYAIRPEQEVHAHCGGGGAAAVPYFALKFLADHPKVKLSIESQMGWLQDERGLPFWTYAAPGMMRETEWLQAWGGKMLRMYGISRLSVLDVRPAAAYAQGHIPFAVSVPAETFTAHAGDARKLAEVLGSSGVDASHEALVVSGAGVTTEAALAYVMLERMGQKKISIFTDSLETVESLDKLARGGLGLTKEATIVGAPSKPGEAAVPPTTYPAVLRNDVTVASANGGGGAYPRVFIASGAAVSAKAPGGKVVHIPYTQLLNGNGSPKAAKEIHAILSKAGVSRYSELVTFSDDPGEAAANYFVLKLMGYPDIKVLML